MHAAYAPAVTANPHRSRVTVTEVEPSSTACFRDAVSQGLGKAQKALPCRFLYDEQGSRLFERITRLPEYYLTRCEDSILSRFARQIVRSVEQGSSVVEFGSGSSAKTRHVLRAAIERGPTTYSPIDISTACLTHATSKLAREYRSLRIRAIVGEYRDAIRLVRGLPSPRLYLFLGSNIGNYEPHEACDLLSTLAAMMGHGDRLLVGIDLAKGRGTLERAYNDRSGLTELFNKNLLERINRELGGRFDTSLFAHRAPYLPSLGRVEMRLVSKQDQVVEVEELGQRYRFDAGEEILTEISAKYTVRAFDRLCRQAGLARVETWRDSRRYFANVLLARSP